MLEDTCDIPKIKLFDLIVLFIVQRSFGAFGISPDMDGVQTGSSKQEYFLQSSNRTHCKSHLGFFVLVSSIVFCQFFLRDSQPKSIIKLSFMNFILIFHFDPIEPVFVNLRDSIFDFFD